MPFVIAGIAVLGVGFLLGKWSKTPLPKSKA